ncbi:hypothetical protein F511_32681 [Dorcoceras hygrometricum]|uniref:Uncharacterized protein n=1 Tax=Dorcoceras hygrometricum TaxID=472368 RepID=A0A2Z7ALT5_9LAMI|nr:hypothetical protein F511_32681 [Dorcoceras hygrometricum]
MHSSFITQHFQKKSELIFKLHQILKCRNYYTNPLLNNSGHYNIIAKYREMLLRKILEAHHKNFRSGQPTTAIDLQIISLLSDAHLFALETLKTQMRIHGLKWERMCSSSLFEVDSRYRGAVIARSNTNNRSSCWIQTMILVDGSWIIQQGGDFWKCLTKPVVSLEWQIPPQRQFVDTLAPVCDFFKIIRKRWADVCIDVVQFSAFNLLHPVGSHNFCRALVVRGPVRDLEVDPTEFCGVFRQGPDVQLISSYSSSSSIHPDLTSSDSFSQCHLDTVLTSPIPSTSTDSPLNFTTDDIPLGVETAVDQILMPSADVTLQDFTEPLAQLCDSVKQIQIEHVHKRDDVKKLKDVLLLHIRGLEQHFTEILEQQDRTYRVQKEVIFVKAEYFRCEMQKAVSAVGKENRHCEFVYGHSELNLLHIPFFRNGNDPLEDFNYNDPRSNTLIRPEVARTPSNTTAHQPTCCVCLTHFFTTSVRKDTRTCLTYLSKYYNECLYV